MALASALFAVALSVLPLAHAEARERDARSTVTRATNSDERGKDATKKTRRELEAEQRQQREEAKRYAIQPEVSGVFAEVRELLAAERYDRAERALRKLRKTRLGDYEKAQVARLYGYVAYGKQQNAVAIEQLGKALTGDVLRRDEQADVLFQIAQIQVLEKRWADAVASLQAWFRVAEKPGAAGYYMLALAQFQRGDLEAALLPAQQAVALARVPQAAWLQLLLAIHLTKKDFAAATPVLASLISHHPNSGKGYWMQLSALYAVNDEDERALAVMEVAHRKGLLTEEKDLIRLAQLDLLLGIPVRAAEVLEKGLAAKHLPESADTYELLSGAWIMAREIAKAGPPLARAAELAPKGHLYVRLAQVHMLLEDWKAAAAALNRGLAKGGLPDASAAELMLGITYFNLRELEQARTWFARAQRSGTRRDQARTWIEHVDRELATRRTHGTTTG
jgi:tetratricopeptide (TPR) repeat protein